MLLDEEADPVERRGIATTCVAAERKVDSDLDHLGGGGRAGGARDEDQKRRVSCESGRFRHCQIVPASRDPVVLILAFCRDFAAGTPVEVRARPLKTESSEHLKPKSQYAEDAVQLAIGGRWDDALKL